VSTIAAPALGVALALLVAGCSVFSSSPPLAKQEPPPKPAVQVSTHSDAPAPHAEAPRPVSPTPAPRGEALSVGPAPPRESRESGPIVGVPQPKPLIAQPPAGAAPAPAPAPPGPKRFVVFNFDNADLEAVVQAASEIVSFNYVIAPGARGKKVTVQTTGRIAGDEVFAVLLTILDVNGLAAVRSGNLYRIIPREGAPQTPVRTIVGRDIDAAIPGDEVLTQIVPLQYVNAADAVNLLRPFVPQQGGLSAHRETNLLIITDTSANIRRMLEIIRLTDVQVALEEMKIISLKHADAQEMAQLLSQIFATGRVAPGVATGVPPFPPAGSPGAPGAPRPPSADPGAAGQRPPLIVAERRSNSLIVNASKQEMETIRRLIEQLDVDIYGGQRVFIYFVENTKARDLAATLDAIFGRGTGPSVTGSQSVAGAPSASVSRPGAPPSFPAAPPTPAAAPRPTPGGPARPPGLAGGAEEGGIGPAGEIRFIADEVTNAIIVTTYPRSWKDIEETIKKLDRMARQVLIEVLAAEVTLSDDTKLGIEWAVRSGRFDTSFGTRAGASSGSSTIGPRPSRGLITPPFGGSVLAGLNFFTFATDEFMSALNALASENKVNVLSSPSIMTAENKKAVINVSTSVPIVTGQQVPVATGGTTGNSITQQVEYRDAGIILTVTPRIGEQGTVALDVKQEVNEVGANEPPPINSPRFTKREAETSVVLMNNQTLVLGGLIQSKRTVTRTGIPFLNRIPILGLLFGSTGERIEKTELLLLITPRVVGTPVDAARITNEMRQVTPELKESIRQSPRPPSR
jgi:general secretion pathway protein D